MSGPIRGMRNVEGKLLIVSGNQLYQISNTGIAIPRGAVPGVGPVQMAHNQKGNGNEVIIVNGSAGYIYNTSTLVFTKITDEGYPGAKCVAYLASYFLQVEPAGRFWFHSDLADGFAYNTLDRYESEAAPDRIVGLIDSQLEVIVFNETTTEFFVNTGAATGTFQSKGIVIETGCAGSNAYAKLDNSVMWLDDKGVVQRMEGYSARPISTRVLERQIAQYKSQWSNVVAMTWEDKGHKVFYLTFPNGYTFGYDVTTGVWTRRQSWGMDRWRLSCLVYWNKRWIGGDYQQDKLYELDWRYMYDGRDPHVRRATTGFISNDQRRLTVPSAEIVFDTGGVPEPIADFPAQPEGPTITAPPLPDGTKDVSWAGGTYTATGGTPPYTYTSRPGTVWPSGLGPMSASGVVGVDTPTASGTGVNIARVTDANGLFDEVTDSFVIDPSPFPGIEPPTGIMVEGYGLDVDIPLPPVIDEDDLLIMQAVSVTLGATANTVSPVAGWTLIDELQQQSIDTRHIRVGWYYKVADGTETGDVTVTGTQSSGWAGQIHRALAGTYDPAEVPEVEMTFHEGPIDITCPTIVPSWGSASNLCIAGYGFRFNDLLASPDGYPLPYNNVDESGGTSGTAYASVASCTGELSGTSISPGDYNRNADDPAIVSTLVVKAAP